MPRPLTKILFAALTLSGCFAAQALLDGGHEPASAAQVENLTQNLAMCPELGETVAGALDRHYGSLPKGVASQLIDVTRHCHQQRRQLPEAQRGNMAYASLMDIAHRHSDDPARRTPQGPYPRLKLSTRLQQ